MPRVVVLLIAVSLATGCTGGSDEHIRPDGQLRAEAVGSRFQQDPVIPENGTAPREFVDRERLPSCGSYAWTLHDEGPPVHLWRCLANSLGAGDPAEVIVQAPGIGSTAVAYYRVHAGAEQVEVWHRDTMDDQWWRGTCAALDAEKGPARCEAEETFEQGGARRR